MLVQKFIAELRLEGTKKFCCQERDHSFNCHGGVIPVKSGCQFLIMYFQALPGFHGSIVSSLACGISGARTVPFHCE